MGAFPPVPTRSHSQDAAYGVPVHGNLIMANSMTLCMPAMTLCCLPGVKLPPGSGGSLRPPSLPAFRHAPAPRPPPSVTRPPPGKALVSAPLRRPVPPPRPKAAAAPPAVPNLEPASVDKPAAVPVSSTGDTAGRPPPAPEGPAERVNDSADAVQEGTEDGQPEPAVPPVQTAQPAEPPAPAQDTWPGYRPTAGDAGNAAPAQTGPTSPFAARSGADAEPADAPAFERAAGARCGLTCLLAAGSTCSACTSALCLNDTAGWAIYGARLRIQAERKLGHVLLAELSENLVKAQTQHIEHTVVALRRLPAAISAMSHASSAALLAAAEGNLVTLGGASRSLAPPMFLPPAAVPQQMSAFGPRPAADPALPSITEPLSAMSNHSGDFAGGYAGAVPQEPPTGRSIGSGSAASGSLPMNGPPSFHAVGSTHTSMANNFGGSSIAQQSQAGSGYAASAKVSSAGAQVSITHLHP